MEKGRSWICQINWFWDAEEAHSVPCAFAPILPSIMYGLLWASFFLLFSFPALFRPVLTYASPLLPRWF